MRIIETAQTVEELDALPTAAVWTWVHAHDVEDSDGWHGNRVGAQGVGDEMGGNLTAGPPFTIILM